MCPPAPPPINPSAPSTNSKLSRNKISARYSRQRKKLYIDLMEAKLAKLQADKQKLQGDLAGARQKLDRVSAPQGFRVDRAQALRKLEQMVGGEW